MHNKKGFTLVEMLIVIVIIGLLATTLVPKIIGAMAKARNVARTADMRNLSIALTVHLDTEGYVPNLSGAASSLGDDLSSYIKSIPIDPSGNKLNGILFFSTVGRHHVVILFLIFRNQVETKLKSKEDIFK